MDINEIRSLVTVLGLIAFVALVAATWSHNRRQAHEEAAMLPFNDCDANQDNPGVKP